MIAKSALYLLAVNADETDSNRTGTFVTWTCSIVKKTNARFMGKLTTLTKCQKWKIFLIRNYCILTTNTNTITNTNTNSTGFHMDDPLSLRQG